MSNHYCPRCGEVCDCGTTVCAHPCDVEHGGDVHCPSWMGHERGCYEAPGVEKLHKRAETAERERDSALAEVGMLKMGFEPAPTADAYEAVCEARTKWQERVEKAKAENMRLRAIMDRLPKTVDGMPIVPGMTVFIPHPHPSNLITEREVVAPYGTLACLTKEPAHFGCCESTAHRLARECYSTREAALAAKEASDA